MKKRREILKAKIEIYLKKEQLFKHEEHKRFEQSFLTKSRKNLAVANILFKISDEENTRKLLLLASAFETYDWVIIVSYYAMYTSALAALARFGFKSKSHAGTITVLEYHYVAEKKDENKSSALEQKDISSLTKAYDLSEQFITNLIQIKTKRETAQYDATPSLTKEMARAALEDADAFMTKIEEILSKT